MFRWISGRLGRPLASIITITMLALILTPLSPPQLQAEDTSTDGGTNWGDLLEMLSEDTTVTLPTPIVILDFPNRSKYRSGMLDRKMAASLSMTMQATGKFTVVPRADVDQKMDELMLSVPMSESAQAMLADRLNAPYTISGEIEEVDIITDRDGTSAQVTVSALVISRITRLPINGARITTKSSPKLAFDGNRDALVEEALSIAAFQMTQRILDNRIPVTTLLMAPSDPNQFEIRGGSIMGIKEGMLLVAVRQESVSGILKVTSVTPSDSQCRVLDNRRGVSPGDKVVPIFSLSPPLMKEATKKKSDKQLAMLAGGALLAAFIGTATRENNTVKFSAAPLADAVTYGLPAGGNLVRWSKGNKKVLSYIVYRTDRFRGTLPIAVVPGNESFYIDEADIPSIITIDGDDDEGALGLLGYGLTYTITIDPDKPGPLVSETRAITAGQWNLNDNTLDDPIASYSIDSTGSEITIEIPYLPLLTGENVSYMIQTIYYGYTNPNLTEPPAQDELTYSLYLGPLSKPSNSVFVLSPPIMITEDMDSAISGSSYYFQAEPVLHADDYVLQISSSPIFDKNLTYSVPAVPVTTGSGEKIIEAIVSMETLASAMNGATTLYYRIGAKSIDTAAPVAAAYSYYDGYVFSERYQFSLLRSLLRASRSLPTISTPGFANYGIARSKTQSRSVSGRHAPGR